MPRIVAGQAETSSLDPLLNTFMTVDSIDDVRKRVQNMFRKIDSGNNGGLSHQELYEGVAVCLRFPPDTLLSRPAPTRPSPPCRPSPACSASLTAGVLGVVRAAKDAVPTGDQALNGRV